VQAAQAGKLTVAGGGVVFILCVRMCVCVYVPRRHFREVDLIICTVLRCIRVYIKALF
jgi:hypothetical protein